MKNNADLLPEPTWTYTSALFRVQSWMRTQLFDQIAVLFTYISGDKYTTAEILLSNKVRTCSLILL